MFKVKVLKEHGNSFGETYEKAVDDTYSCDEGTARALIRDGLAELAEGELEPITRPRLTRRR